MKSILLICAVLIAIPELGSGQDIAVTPGDSLLDVYEYPIKPGTPEWRNLKSGAEMIETLQIPDSILSKMSTEGLVVTCLNYPSLWHMGAYDSYQRGVEIVMKRFNGFVELSKRADAGTFLMKEYLKLDPDDLDPDWSAIQKGGFQFQFMHLEMILSQRQFLEKLSHDERIALLKNSLDKYTAKVFSESYKSTFIWKTNVLLIGRILLVEEDSEFKNRYDHDEELRIFLDTVNDYTVELFNTIVYSADQYVKGKSCESQ